MYNVEDLLVSELQIGECVLCWLFEQCVGKLCDVVELLVKDYGFCSIVGLLLVEVGIMDMIKDVLFNQGECIGVLVVVYFDDQQYFVVVMCDGVVGFGQVFV